MNKIKTSAPGSLMLMGEHAVLYGGRALACAIDQRIHVCVEVRNDGGVAVDSSLGLYEGSAKVLDMPTSLRFVQAICARYSQPVSIRITSEFSSTVGLGSSSAVTVALLLAMRKLCNKSLDQKEMFDEAYSIIREIQGGGSGTDVAASVYGGIISYSMEPRKITSIDGDLSLLLVYCGYKTPTSEVIRLVGEAYKKDPERYKRFFETINDCTTQAQKAIIDNNMGALSAAIQKHQECMANMGLTTPELEEIVQIMKNMPNVYGAKISGSGLGDCVLGIGQGDWPSPAYEQIPVSMSKQGASVDN